MPIDTSIYQAIKPVQIDMPSPLDSAQRAMQLSRLGMENQQNAIGLATQKAMRDAYAQNTDQDGQVNRQGVISALSRVNPMAAMQQQQGWAKMDKDAAEAHLAKIQDAHQQISTGLPFLKYALQIPKDQVDNVWPQIRQQMADAGLDTSRIPEPFDRNLILQRTMVGDQMKEALENQLTQAGVAEKYASTEKLKSETPHPMGAGPIASNTDPATLVPHYVPVAKQKDVNEEIKKAQDIKNLAPKIMDAFDQASSRNPNTARNGRKIFESLINTTVTDLTGTARQAEFDSIHANMTPSGLFAAPGENDSKKKAVLAYLAAKSAAPTAKGYGIDLSKFDSTAPYQGAPAKATGQGESGTAYAAPIVPKHGEVQDGYVFMGGDPSKSSSWKKATR